MKTRVTWVILLLLFIFCFNESIAGDYYVKQTATGTANGTSWTNAYGPDGFALALLTAQPGDVFHLGAGTYKPYYDLQGNLSPRNPRSKTFYIRNGVTLKGGYDTDGTNYEENENSPAKVILSGNIGVADNRDNTYHVIVTASAITHSQTGIMNLTVADGYANGGGNNSKGGGIFISSNAQTPVILSRIHVRDNQANIQGAGIHIDVDADAMVSYSEITDNKRIGPSDVWGGGINVWYSNLTIKNSVVSGNTSRYGAGIHLTRSKLVSENCVYKNNQAEIHGGGIDCYNHSNVVIKNDSVLDNWSINGGGIHNEAGSVFVGSGLVIKRNTASHSGGGFFNNADCKAEFNDCIFDANIAENRGGGIQNYGRMDVNRNRIINNRTIGAAWGGGINQVGGRLNVRQTEISGNHAKYGAGFCMESGIAVVSNTTISGNNASIRAGGVYSYSGIFTLNAVTVTNNTAPTGSGIYNVLRPALLNSIVSGNAAADDLQGRLNESGSSVSANNIIGTKFYKNGNKTGDEVNFNPSVYLGPLDFDTNRSGQTRVHKLLWTGSSNSNPAVGRGVLSHTGDATLLYDQTLKERGTRPSLGAYEVDLFKAENDIVSTDKDMPVTFDVGTNDAVPAQCTPVFTIIEQPKNGTVTQFNPYTYTPNAGWMGGDTIKYRMSCILENTPVSDEAYIIIRVGKQYDRPSNIIDQTICMGDMPTVNFIARKKYSRNEEHLNGFSMPMVGDLNGDGKPEIVGLGLTVKNAPLDAYVRYVVIYNGQTGDVINKTDLRTFGYAEALQFKLRYEPRHNGISHLALADLDNDGIGEIVITETGSKGRVYALKPEINPVTKEITSLRVMWTAQTSHKSPVAIDQTQFGAPMPYITDLNGDGHTEIIVYNKIYDGKTGVLLLEMEELRYFSGWVESQTMLNTRKNYAYVGRRHSLGPSADNSIPVISIIDIDEDGILEIVAGMKIYKPKIVSRTDKSQNGFDIIRGPEQVVLPYGTGSATRTYYLTDGFTSVADVDGDDKLDIIVQSVVLNYIDVSYHAMITVWSPEDLNNVKAATIIRGNSATGTSSIPFVGDINGKYDSPDGTKKLPEICITTGMVYRKRGSTAYTSGTPFHPLADNSLLTGNFDKDRLGARKGHVIALTYDESEPAVHDRLKISWALEHDDESASTGITMFDFDNDGAMDLAYRDEKSIRVISPKLGSNYVKVSEDETSHDAIRFRFTDNGKLMAYTGFEAPVIADVNGDGSADIISFSYAGAHALSIGYPYVFESAGDAWAPSMPVWNQGIYFPLQINTDLSVPRRPQSTLTKYEINRNGVLDTIQPYNGSWIQQPIVRESNYVPVLTSPDPSLEGMRIISSTPTRTIVRLTVENRSMASAVSTTPITFYKNSISNGNIIARHTLGVDVYDSETVNVDFTLTGDYTANIIFARLVDNNGDFVAAGFRDCDETNNMLYAMQVKATDDYYTMYSSEELFDVRLNDTAFCDMLPEIIQSSANGYVEITADSLLLYRPLLNFTGKDTLRYVIKCSYTDVTVYDTAAVYITSNQSPDNIMETDCQGSPITNWDFEMLQESAEEYPVWSALIAGDIDSDGNVELIVPKIDPAAPDVHFSSQLAVLDLELNEKHVINTPYFSNMAPSVAIANVDGYDDAAIFLTTSRNDANPADERLLIKYVFDRNNNTYRMDWKERYSANPDYDLGIPYITDFNGDGNADILVYDKVFDARTGRLLVDAGFVGSGGTYANGFAEGGIRTNLSRAGYAPFVAIGELGGIDKDGLPEIAMGNYVYKVTINSTTDHTQNTFSVLKKLNGGYMGPTSLADMDLDGYLDIIVLGYNGSIYFPYIWNPRTEKRMDTHNTANAVPISDKPAILSVTDTDTDKYPEIIVPMVNGIRTFDFDNTGKLTIKRTFPTNASAGTGIVTLFDFDYEGIPEGIFKDSEQVRIVRTDGIRFSAHCAGKPGNGYPLVLDINQDYHYRSEIVAIGGADSNSESGTVRIYGGKFTRKAPARTVWNQFAYSILNINENLTVPAYPLSNTMVYPGTDGQLGTTDDVRPFNSYMQQSSLMNGNGIPVYPIPNAVIVTNPQPNYQSYPEGDSAVITFQFTNEGAIPFYPNFHIAAYKNSIQYSNLLATDSVNAIINVGETVTAKITIRNISNYNPINNTIVRLNDKGDPNYPFAQQECEYADNDYTFIKDFTINNDLAFTNVNTPVEINVLANDEYRSCPDLKPKEISLGNTMRPKHGQAEIKPGTDLILYTPDDGFYGIDSFRYRAVDCNNIEALAWVHVVVARAQSSTYIACRNAKITLAMIPIEGVSYTWIRNNTTIMRNADSLVVTKDASAVQPYHVEVFYKNTLIGRYYIDLLLSENCEELVPTSECMTRGTTLFKEDFGGNDTINPRISQMPLPVGITDYSFNTNNALGYSENNSYWLLKYNSNQKGGLGANFQYDVWHKNFSDHTYPNNLQRGYMFMVDAAKEPGKFYECTLDGLCSDTKLYFSVWICNLMMIVVPEGLEDNPDLRFELSDEKDNVLATFVTGEIWRDARDGIRWKHYGFEFELEKAYQKIKLKIFNNKFGSSGNDFAMDDIQIKLCLPPAEVTISGNTEVCSGETVSFNGTYTDDGTFGNNLVYQWLFRADENDQWSILKEGTGTNPLNTSFNVSGIAKNQEGYYRLAVANSLTISRENCRAASEPLLIRVERCLEAVNDTISVIHNGIVSIPVLTNDIMSSCDQSTAAIDTVPDSGLHHGTLIINSNNTLTYTPRKGVYGIDSVDYYIRCGQAVSTARVYIVVMKPVSDIYLACENTVAMLQMHPINDVEYNWYNSLDALLEEKSDNLEIMKNSLAVQSFYIRCSYKGKRLNARYRVDLLLNENCGMIDPTGCALTGRLLFREDFGGNNPADPLIKQTGIPQVTGSVFTTDEIISTDKYSIRKQGGRNNNDPYWYRYTDHTYPDDLSRGYLIQFNASGAAARFYEHQIDNLCDSVNLYFSTWVANTANISFPNKPNLIFMLENPAGDRLATYYTGDIPDQDSTWKQYGFNFIVPESENSVILKIMNNTKGDDGNDFVMDDIEIRLCVPPVTVSPGDTALCAGENITLSASYTDDGSFGNNLVYRWLYRSDNPNDKWIVLEEKTSVNPVNASLVLNNIDDSKKGYYQLQVAGRASIDFDNCSAVSDSVNLTIHNKYPVQDIRIQLCTVPVRDIPLSRYINTQGIELISWNKSLPLAPDIKPGTETTTATVNTADFGKGIYVYRYTVKDSCSNYDGWLYIATLMPENVNMPADTVVICQEMESARHFNLEQVAGLAIKGDWVYDNTVNPDNVVADNIIIPAAPAIDAGAYIFNAAKAWYEAPDTDYLIPGGYNGDMNAKLFNFEYRIDPSTGCTQTGVKKIVIIVTEKVVN